MSIGSGDCVLACVCKSVSSLFLTSGTKYSSMCRKVFLMSAVNDPSGFLNVVSCVLFFVFPAANLYTSSQGLVDDVMLQYSFHELIFSFLIVAAYLTLPYRYCVLRFCLRASLFLVLWYLRLSAFNFFLIIVSSSVHQVTNLFDTVFFEARCVPNDLLHADFKTSWNSSIKFSMSVSSDTRVHSV